MYDRGEARYGVGARILADAVGWGGAVNDYPTALIFQTCPDGDGTLADRMTIDSAGDVTFTGDLIMADGKGIDFSATSDATGRQSELLDDYEEGSYVPTISDTGEGGTPTLSGDSDVLSYTKIGRFVSIVGTLQVTDVTSCTGTLAITLPFTAKANASGSGYHGVSIVTYTVNINGSLGVVLQPNPSEAKAQFYAEVDNSTANNQMATGYYRINFQYEA
jgi:hypothetical protein